MVCEGITWIWATVWYMECGVVWYGKVCVGITGIWATVPTAYPIPGNPLIAPRNTAEEQKT